MLHHIMAQIYRYTSTKISQMYCNNTFLSLLLRNHLIVSPQPDNVKWQNFEEFKHLEVSKTSQNLLCMAVCKHRKQNT